jgi:hypothetical protein
MNAQHHIWRTRVPASVKVPVVRAVVRRVDNSFDQYWATNDGTIIGRNWGTQPDPSWHHLEPIKL